MKSEEIAKIAGVSRSTVSRVINNYKNVPEETREKVMKVIDQYNYMPNSFARTLAGKKSNTIGLFFIVAEGKHHENRIFQNDYFTHYLNLLVDMANARDYFVLISIVSEATEYSKISQAFLEKRIDGAIIIGTHKDTLKRIHAENIRSSIILFDYDITDEEKDLYNHANISIINSKDEEAMEKSVSYLVALGHTEIGFIRGIPTSKSAQDRYIGFQKAMHLSKIPIKEEYSFDGHFSIQETYKNMKEMIRKKCLATAYIAANDFMAIGAMNALTEANYRIPDDISLIGFDNSHRANEVQPKLTTLAPDFFEMSKKAIEILDAKLKGEEDIPELLEYSVAFYERDSCKKL